MMRFVFIVGSPVHSHQEQLILDLIPRALHNVACSQLDNTGTGSDDGDCSECLRALAAEPSSSWEKTAHGLKCSVDKAAFELLFDASFADVRNALRGVMRLPAARRIIVYVGAVGQNGFGSTSTSSSATIASVYGHSCSSAWLLHDAQVGPAELVPIVTESEAYLANLLHLVRLDHRNAAAALAQNEPVDEKDEPLELGTVELLVPFADNDWLALEKRPSVPGTYTLRVSALEHATASADDSVTDSVAQLASRLAQAVHFEPAERALVASDLAGNIHFSRPTLYVFASGDGDAALLGVPGFAMLLDGGYSAQPAYWQLIRHVDRIDAVLVSHAGLDNIFGLANILRQKAAANASILGPSGSPTPNPPVLAHALFNAFVFGSGETRPVMPTPTLNALKVNSVIETDELVRLITANRIPVSPLLRAAGQPLTPINLFHKIGQGSFDLYVLNPTDCAKELKEMSTYCEKLLRDVDTHAAHLSQSDADIDVEVTLTGKCSKSAPVDRRQPAAKIGPQSFPLGDFVSVCALLVYHPASPTESVTRILLTGACPQLKVLEGLERMRHAEFLKVSEYHDAPLRTLSFGQLPANGFSLSPASPNSQSSGGAASVASRKRNSVGGRAPPSRPSTSAPGNADTARFKAPSTPAPARTRAPLKVNGHAAPAMNSAKNTAVNGDAKASNQRLIVTASTKKLPIPSTKNGQSDERPKTAPVSASTKSLASATPRRKAEPERAPIANGGHAVSVAKAKPAPKATGAKQMTPLVGATKRTIKDNSAALSATNGVKQNHSLPVSGNAKGHPAEPSMNGNAMELLNGHAVALNGETPSDEVNTATTPSDVQETTPDPVVLEIVPAPDVQEMTPPPDLPETTALPDVEETTHTGDVQGTTPPPDVEETRTDDVQEITYAVEVEMSAEEFARAIAMANGDQEDMAVTWGSSLGLPPMANGDDDGDVGQSSAEFDANGVAHAHAANDADEGVAPPNAPHGDAEHEVLNSSAAAADYAVAEAGPTPTPQSKVGQRGPSKTKPVTTAKAPSSTSKQSAAPKVMPATKPAETKKQPQSAASSTAAQRQSLSARNTKPASTSATKNAVGSPTKERSSNTGARSSANATSTTGGSAAISGIPFYVDLAYIPAHGNPKYVDVEFFRRVRARYYVLSCLQPSAKVLDALLDAKATSWETLTQTTLIPTYDSDQLATWMTTNRERLVELQVDVAPPANRCTVQLQDHTDQCNAYRLEF